MKYNVIGDIHGTTKWIDCYQQILEKDNDCDKIISDVLWNLKKYILRYVMDAI